MSTIAPFPSIIDLTDDEKKDLDTAIKALEQCAADCLSRTDHLAKGTRLLEISQQLRVKIINPSRRSSPDQIGTVDLVKLDISILEIQSAFDYLTNAILEKDTAKLFLPASSINKFRGKQTHSQHEILAILDVLKRMGAKESKQSAHCFSQLSTKEMFFSNRKKEGSIVQPILTTDDLFIETVENTLASEKQHGKYIYNLLHSRELSYDQIVAFARHDRGDDKLSYQELLADYICSSTEIDISTRFDLLLRMLIPPSAKNTDQVDALAVFMSARINCGSQHRLHKRLHDILLDTKKRAANEIPSRSDEFETAFSVLGLFHSIKIAPGLLDTMRNFIAKKIPESALVSKEDSSVTTPALR